MDFRGKLNQEATKKIEENWPKIQQVFQEKIGPAALAAAQNDDSMRAVFKIAHKALPFPLGMVIKEEAFVDFCLAHRDNLLPKSESAGSGR
jgi:hypothetical protein